MSVATPTKKKTSRKALAIVLAGLGIAALGVTVASAVQLGIEENNDLAANVSITETCQPTSGPLIKVGFSEPVYVATPQGFTVASVQLTNIAAACNGKDVKVVVAGASGAPLGSVSSVVAGGSLTVTLPAPVDTASVESVAVTIYDAD